MLCLANREAKYFSREGWTRASLARAVICPSGNWCVPCLTSEQTVDGIKFQKLDYADEPMSDAITASASMRPTRRSR
jgi:hypothetical protein